MSLFQQTGLSRRIQRAAQWPSFAVKELYSMFVQYWWNSISTIRKLICYVWSLVLECAGLHISNSYYLYETLEPAYRQWSVLDIYHDNYDRTSCSPNILFCFVLSIYYKNPSPNIDVASVYWNENCRHHQISTHVVWKYIESFSKRHRTMRYDNTDLPSYPRESMF